MEHLHYEEQHRVWICITCRHAVWPQEIVRHFRNKKKHDIPKVEQQQMREKILGAPYDAVDDPDEFIMPSQVIEAIPHLTLHEDGYRCCVEDCHTIRSSVVDIRKHCRTAHNQTIHRHRGKPTTAGRRAASTRRDQMWRSVARYQRFFASREHSQYFEVRLPARTAHAAEASDIDQRINTEIARIQGSSQRAKEEADRNIEPGEVSDANQWLERAQFAKYLSGYEWETLMALIDRPETEFEPVEYIMWKAMDGLGRFSQRTVREKAGVFVRFEAVRSEKHQTRYQPLMAYQDEQSFSSYVRPWQQIIMFFARTRTAELRKENPQYRFNRRQSQAWEQFVQVAEDIVEHNQTTDPVTPQRRQHRSRRRIIEDDETDAEEDAIRAQSVEEQQELEDVQRACLQFCIALMDCPASTQHHEYEFAMVRAMAVLGVKTHGWKGPDQYPPLLFRVIKIARFLVVQQAWEEVQPVDVWDDEGYRSDQDDDGEDHDVENGSTEGEQRASPSNSQDSAIDVPVPKARQGVIEVVRDMMDRFMVRGSGSPMQWLLDLRTYGLKIHYNTTAPGSVRWSGASQLTYKGMEIGMDAFRGFVHGLEGAARTQLQAAVLMGHTPPVIPWQNMRDNPSETEVRFNFLQSEQWVSSVDGGSWLWQQVQGNAEQREQWFHADSGHIRRRETIEWMDMVEVFRMQMLLLMHITGGQPARAPEILSIHHENRSSQQLRNVFLEDGLITFVTRYHKGYMMSGDVKIIHRYLPREVGEMFVWYLWLVLPFYNDIDQHFQREDEARHQRVEHPDPNETEEHGRISPAADGQEATATPQRHTPRRGPSTHLWPASHRKQKMTSARLREGLKRYSRLYLGEALTIASYREVAIAISRQYMGRESAFVTDLDQIGEEGGEDGEGSIGKRLQAIIDQQAGHTSHIAGMIYARLVGELQGSVADVRQGFRKASEMWHTWLGFASADRHSEPYRRVHGRKRGAPIESPWQGIQQQARRGRETWLRQAPIEEELQRMIGPDIRFRGIQEAAMRSIIRGDPRIVAVMPTGCGKSILFQLPAFVTPGGLTIVVVPITALRADMMQRCVAVNIVAYYNDRSEFSTVSAKIPATLFSRFIADPS
ncbi:hypothetical protein LTR56_027628 [Elasticomyces elasticus]|nr:hypothetical protein LTR56_027628 [Elasticomyces elasticus]KAK3619846.1 hypothetical protein LTR22_025819 [Elasticomyces elasticus]KAK4896500.1 hypothetical protein LTR49_028135 [Elasticomyces elasticus]KAK5733340.1 hypothetical protein LTS12_026968 [Elasticomyces elasticus]